MTGERQTDDGRSPIGQSWLRESLRLRVAPAAYESFVVAGRRKTEVTDGKTTELYPKHYGVEPDALSHLKFALRHEPFDLGVMVATLRAIGKAPLERWLAEEPTGAYSRRAWFLYETLLGETLDVEPMTRGSYVDALDPARHMVSASSPSARHRVNDNLLGGRGYCPTVRRTERLIARMSERIDDEARRLVDAHDPLLLTRAVNYLYTKETKSSFAIERESADDKRAARFIAALHDARTLDPTSKEELVALQGQIVDPRYAARDWRDFQNFIGETVGGYREAVHYICPRPSDVGVLMDAWARSIPRLMDAVVDAVVAAAILGFGFVLIHPFEDGNGRIHRFLIHHVLARRSFTPADVIFPVSAAILRDRRGYEAVLESFSAPVNRLVEWHWTPEREIVVDNDTADLYRYFDATAFAEYLYDRVADTVRRDLKDELDFVVLYDHALRAARAVADMPDKRASLFVRLVLENHGRLSNAKRPHFAELSDDEVVRLEEAVRRAMDAVPSPFRRARLTT